VDHHVLAGVLTAGRRATLIVAGAIAAGQLAIAAALAVVTIAHLGAPAASFGAAASAPAGTLATATGQTALLYICGSLPLFLGAERIYADLIRPSLVALWLSQLIVFAAYPRFAARHRHRMLPAWSLTVVAVALTLYGLWTTIHQAGS
jgi:hypothetical protein